MGSPNPPPMAPSAPRSSRVGSVGAPIGVLVALGLLAGVLLLIFGASNPAGVLLAVPCSAIAVVIVVTAYLWLDRWEPEPIRLLLLAFLWGASVAVIAALVLEIVTGAVLGDGASLALGGPVIEEAAKGAFLLIMLTGSRRREFDGIVDGLVYAGLTAIGFAFIEDVAYISDSFSSGTTSGISTVVLRCLIAPFAHPLFTSMTGLGVGLYVSRPADSRRRLYPVIGYLVAVGLHALWNGSLLFGFGGYLLVYFLIMVPAFLLAAAVARWQRRRERDIVGRQLPAMVYYRWITSAEAGWLDSIKARRRWAKAVAARSGRPGLQAVRRFQTAATELAFLRDRVERGYGPAAAYALHADLLDTLATSRARAVGPLRQLPPPTTGISPKPPARVMGARSG